MKKAILVVSFGTSYEETRQKTIEACENKIKESFEGYDFYRAFTSGMIINKLKKRDNLFIDNPKEALEKLYNQGYKEVVVQSLHIICGDEYNKLKDMMAPYEDKFERISLGRPLLTYIDDYRETVEAVKQELDEMDIDEAVVFMGHGTEHESHSAYPAIEYMFRDYDINAYVGTVEGYPELDQVIKKLKEAKVKTVDLMPFMLVAGDHAINDMASDEEDSWKTILENEGFIVKTHLKGLGENPFIQNKFKNHALDCMKQLAEVSI
ncbi:MAG: sirohydrochlorin cobaltochelatase [Terrisporobacter sp.]|uniref:sirohydrochlorin cobaltochelatase n=1 Tax=Terrisporobacter sp. TaxID=1965305 RepID=UPI002FC9ABA4